MAQNLLRKTWATRAILGIAVTRHAGGLFLSQNKYATEIIERAGRPSCKESPIPVATKLKLSTTTSKPFENPSLYRSLAREFSTLLSLDPILRMQYNRNAYSCVTQRRNMHALKRIFTTYRVILILVFAYFLPPHQPLFCILMLIGVDTRTHYVQRRITVSFRVTLAYCDDVSFIYLASNRVHHQLTKKIELDIHFVREMVDHGEVRVLHVPLRYQIAHIFTKYLPLVLFEYFRDILSIWRPLASTEGGF
uniref:Reverse transcriptase Ty1/copia-type domain-containing protein n=1 Tax=Solanum lycopersicum TaxID=4081 RepID=A0A3Q7I2E9_SOLLC